MFLKIAQYCVRGEKQPVIAELIFLSVHVIAGTKTRESPESRSLIVKRRELVLIDEDFTTNEETGRKYREKGMW